MEAIAAYLKVLSYYLTKGTEGNHGNVLRIDDIRGISQILNHSQLRDNPDILLSV